MGGIGHCLLLHCIHARQAPDALLVKHNSRAVLPGVLILNINFFEPHCDEVLEPGQFVVFHSSRFVHCGLQAAIFPYLV